MNSFVEDFFYLFFPKICCTCGKNLVKNEQVLCFKCRSELPRFSYNSLRDNELKQRFYGKIIIEFALANLQFYKSGITQNLLHEFKYNNKRDIGELFGRQLGSVLKEFKVTEEINLIVPIPLHPKKERKRGYNQSFFLAKGISEVTGISVNSKDLKRIIYTESQTGKSREKRWKSVENAFQVSSQESFESKHILLVDDVITTGATIEASGKKLYDAGASKISVAALAIAK